MRAFLTILSFLCTFVATGNAIVCEDCLNRNGRNCTGQSIDCGPGVNKCEIVIVESKFGNLESVYNIFKGCARPPMVLYDDYQEMTQNFTYRMRTWFCDSDNCNKGDNRVDFLPRNDCPNGVVCPACFAPGSSKGCEPKGTIQCAGSMKACMYFAGAGRLGEEVHDTSYRGCVNIRSRSQFPNFPGETIVRIDRLEITKGSRQGAEV
ncbi:phospholipase A2 inhibitor and Ly6/PLAUR domain-containing protein-like [Ambystoma mexicanum]|uniref:phospholipase A2 inhibitor and Ly6/PLAUR domain-containing protein-like n=1 Tax=Ambystoma mexicanum TaxID=8296 RepID=UPI0037E89886